MADWCLPKNNFLNPKKSNKYEKIVLIGFDKTRFVFKNLSSSNQAMKIFHYRFFGMPLKTEFLSKDSLFSETKITKYLGSLPPSILGVGAIEHGRDIRSVALFVAFWIMSGSDGIKISNADKAIVNWINGRLPIRIITIFHCWNCRIGYQLIFRRSLNREFRLNFCWWSKIVRAPWLIKT